MLTPAIRDYLGTVGPGSLCYAKIALRSLCVVRAKGRLPPTIDAETEAALLRDWRQAGRREKAIRRCLCALRRYARATGDGIDWADATDKLPSGHIRQFLPADAEATLEHLARLRTEEGLPDSNYPDVVRRTITLYHYYCRRLQVLPCYSCESIQQFIAWQKARADSLDPMSHAPVHFRSFLRVRQPDHPWIAQTTQQDLRHLTIMLGAPWWTGYRERVLTLLAQGTTPSSVRKLDKLLKILHEQTYATPKDLAPLIDGKAWRAKQLLSWMRALDPTHPVLHCLRAARYQFVQPPEWTGCQSGPVILPVLTGRGRRAHAAIFSFMAGVTPPMPMLGRSLL